MTVVSIKITYPLYRSAARAIQKEDACRSGEHERPNGIQRISVYCLTWSLRREEGFLAELQAITKDYGGRKPN